MWLRRSSGIKHVLQRRVSKLLLPKADKIQQTGATCLDNNFWLNLWLTFARFIALRLHFYLYLSNVWGFLRKNRWRWCVHLNRDTVPFEDISPLPWQPNCENICICKTFKLMSLANNVKMSRKNGHFLENIVLGHFWRSVGRCPAHHPLLKKKRVWMLCKGKQLPIWLQWKPRYSHEGFLTTIYCFFDSLIKNSDENNEKTVFQDFHSNRCHSNLQCKCKHEM